LITFSTVHFVQELVQNFLIFDALILAVVPRSHFDLNIIQAFKLSDKAQVSIIWHGDVPPLVVDHQRQAVIAVIASNIRIILRELGFFHAFVMVRE